MQEMLVGAAVENVIKPMKLFIWNLLFVLIVIVKA